MYSTHICYEVMNVCYKLSKTVYLEKQCTHITHISICEGKYA